MFSPSIYERHVARKEPEETMSDEEHKDPIEVRPGGEVAVKEKAETKTPSMYKVLLLNDDYTPMNFVIQVLQQFFRMTMEDATETMLNVHNRGVGVCGVFTYEVAETKVSGVTNFSRRHEHPLRCVIEEA